MQIINIFTIFILSDHPPDARQLFLLVFPPDHPQFNSAVGDQVDIDHEHDPEEDTKEQIQSAAIFRRKRPDQIGNHAAQKNNAER